MIFKTQNRTLNHIQKQPFGPSIERPKTIPLCAQKRQETRGGKHREKNSLIFLFVPSTSFQSLFNLFAGKSREI